MQNQPSSDAQSGGDSSHVPVTPTDSELPQSQRQPKSTGAAAEAASHTQLFARLRQEFSNLDRLNKDDSMLAFGPSRTEVLKRVSELREKQFSLFAKHLDAERNMPSLNMGSGQLDAAQFRSNDFEPLTDWFDKKGSDLAQISQETEMLAKEFRDTMDFATPFSGQGN